MMVDRYFNITESIRSKKIVTIKKGTTCFLEEDTADNTIIDDISSNKPAIPYPK